MSDLNASYEEGLKAYKAQRGTDYVEKRFPYDPPSIDDIAKLSISRCYGDSWARPGLDMKTKAFVTISFLIAIGADEQLKSHLLGAHQAGVTKEEIVEWLIHLNSYLGTPKSVIALKIAREVWREMAESNSAAGKS